MIKRVCVMSMAVLAMTMCLEVAATAGDLSDRYLTWCLTPDSTRPHPKTQVLAYLVTEPFLLVETQLSYDQRRFAANEAPALKNGGKMISTLEILRGDSTINIGTKKTKIIATGEDRRTSEIGWMDPSGPGPWFGPHKGSPELPIQLSPGDVILWTVKFKGVKKLEFNKPAESEYVDSIELRAQYFNCGSVEYPCVEWLPGS